ncbi:MAG: indole-3-glycerol phosphate synthase TrpC [Lachnospiraceae bacterium]
MNILDQLAGYARIRVEEKEKQIPKDIIREKAEESSPDTGFPFEAALSGTTPEGDTIHFICECKKASPSKGLIAPEFPCLNIAKEYEKAGASAISVLTEPKWFLGDDRYLSEIAKTVHIPCIRKDFTVDSYMIYEAKLLGASCVLLICAILDDRQLAEGIRVCDSLGLSALVEAHDEEEVKRAAAAGARVIGVNNRNLKDFTVDIHNSERLRRFAPEGTLFVAESGIRTASDVQVLRECGVNGILVGETLMRADDKCAALRELRGSL